MAAPISLADLSRLRDLDPSDVAHMFEQTISQEQQPPAHWMASLSRSERVLAERLCLIFHAVTGGSKCPRQFQLESSLATLSGRDCLVNAGTGSGKTLCMILPMLFEPTGVTITISPLKRLQEAQVREFGPYGIESVAINEDTSDASDVWKRIQAGGVRHLLVQAEQLTYTKGHLPRLGRILRLKSFSRMVRCVNIDEAHFMYMAGEPKYGLPAFRPAWGELAGVRTHLSGVPFLAMSGTLPPHVKACVQELLTPTALVIELTSNRSNLIYAAYPITGAFNNWKNLDFVIPYQYNPHERPRKKIIIYVDQTQSTVE